MMELKSLGTSNSNRVVLGCQIALKKLSNRLEAPLRSTESTNLEKSLRVLVWVFRVKFLECTSILHQPDDVGSQGIVDFLENKVILITGATGFLAKIFVEKILRVQPNVKKLYLLVRAPDATAALQRFNTEAVAKDLFKVLKENHGTNLQKFLSEKVTPVAGDITLEDLGLQDSSLKSEMWRDIDIVVNIAATTKFDERTIDSVFLGYGKGKLTCFPGDPEAVYDVVPADMVVNAMMAAIVAHANQTSCETIYHVGSSVSNPVQFATIQQCCYLYFTEHPWIEKDGKAVIVGEVKVLKSMTSFHRYIALRYLLPLQVLQFVNLISCQAFAGTYKNLKRKITFVLRLVDLYKPYLFPKSFYDDLNTERLRKAVRENGNEENIFYFDPRTVNWADYFQKIHIPGVRLKSLASLLGWDCSQPKTLPQIPIPKSQAVRPPPTLLGAEDDEDFDELVIGRLLPHARGLGFKPRRGGFPSGAKNEWGLSPKAKVRVLHTAQLDVT
nr:gland-specific fatty acyl-CoA reductase 1 [Tanacetum cinerariifolium]